MTAAIGDRYRKAAELGPQRLFGLMRNRIIEPRWTGEGDAFTYVRQAETGATETVLIDPEAGSRVILPTQEQRAVPAGRRILSPDGKREVFRKGHDLALRDVATGEETVLLDGGEPFFAWGRLVDNSMVHLLLKPIVDTLAPVFTGFCRRVATSSAHASTSGPRRRGRSSSICRPMAIVRACTRSAACSRAKETTAPQSWRSST